MARKAFKNKKRACGLCKPHKRYWADRWKPKEKEALRRWEHEKVNYLVKHLTNGDN